MQESAERIWHAAQGLLRSMLSSDIYSLWFEPVQAVILEENVIVLRVANDFCELWLQKNYLELLQHVVTHAAGKELRVRFQVVSADAGVAAASETAKKARLRPAGEAPRDAGPNHEAAFNPRNTFDTFVVGENNNHAHAAALAVAQAPGKSFNPLFIYGGVGLGKTHLLHAIGNYAVGHRKGARVAYLSSEKFTNEYIDALQNSQLVRFRRKYRQTEVLLIDDIQFLSGKERIQEEFFHTFNTLHESHRQIVMTCDRPASEIQNLEQRLVSRFEWGLVADLQPPDVETRLAIVRKKAKMMEASLPDEILNFLADHIRTNIRRLEGALIRVASYASLTGKTLTIELMEELLREVLHEEGRLSISIDIIQKKVAEHFDIRLADMTSKRRPENIAFPRQVAMFLCRKLTGASLPKIGAGFGGRDHTTVLHAYEKINAALKNDPGLQEAVKNIQSSLKIHIG